MSLKGHMVLSGATLNLLKTECFKAARERGTQEDDKGWGGDIRDPPTPGSRFCFPLICS